MRSAELGVSTIDLVYDECVLLILSAMAQGAVRPSTIHSRLAGPTRVSILRRFAALRDGEWIACLDSQGHALVDGKRTPPDAPHVFTSLGKSLLGVPRYAAHWQDRWFPGAHLSRIRGHWALGIVARETNRRIVRHLAGGPLRTHVLIVLMRDRSRSEVMHHLGYLAEYGLLSHEYAGTLRAQWGLTDPMRELAPVMLRAARCEFMRGRPEDLALEHDLPGLLAVVAPRGVVEQGVGGIYRLEMTKPGAAPESMHLLLSGGEVASILDGTKLAPDAVGRASVIVWCQALGSGDFAQIDGHGDLALAARACEAMHRALRHGLDMPKWTDD